MKSTENPTIFFMHQMKSGGVTLSHIIRSLYHEHEIFQIDGRDYRESVKDLITMPDTEKSRFKVIAGHMFFGLHRLISYSGKYITMLRHPIDRVVSLYYYQMRPEHKYHIPADMSLIEYLENGVAMNTDNGMVRFITGRDLPDVPYGQCSIDLLVEAKKNLKEYFLWVGLTEDFDASLQRLGELLNWPDVINYSHRNFNVNKSPTINLSQKELATIKQFNKLDLQLYEFVKNRPWQK